MIFDFPDGPGCGDVSEQGSHGKSLLPWVLDENARKPTAPQPCRGYMLKRWAASSSA